MKKYYLYILLVRTNTIISRLIHIIKKDTYTHASISLDKNLNNLYSFGRRQVYNPFIGCFKKENITSGLYKVYHQSPCEILELEVTKEQYDKACDVIKHFVENSETYKYNYMGLLYILLNKETTNDRFLCSEFVYYVLNECGVLDLNIPKNLVRPQNFLSIKSDRIFKGKINSLNNKLTIDNYPNLESLSANAQEQ
ncbi:MAG: hypothetical protein ACOWWH_00675 [Eubacteriaceae bacterium]